MSALDRRKLAGLALAIALVLGCAAVLHLLDTGRGRSSAARGQAGGTAPAPAAATRPSPASAPLEPGAQLDGAQRLALEGAAREFASSYLNRPAGDTERSRLERIRPFLTGRAYDQLKGVAGDRPLVASQSAAVAAGHVNVEGVGAGGDVGVLVTAPVRVGGQARAAYLELGYTRPGDGWKVDELR